MARSSPSSYALPFSASSSFTSRGSSQKGIFTVKWIRRSGLRLPMSPKYTDSPFSLVSSYGYSRVCSVKNPAVNPVSGSKPSDGILKVPSSSECDVSSSIWNWRGYRIRYQSSGKNGPALILIHGFGANRFGSPIKAVFRYNACPNKEVTHNPDHASSSLAADLAIKLNSEAMHYDWPLIP